MDHTNLYRENFQRVLKAAELGTWKGEGRSRQFFPKFTMYSLRHTAASFALRAGLNVKVVSAMLGHASFTLTLPAGTTFVFISDLAESLTRLTY